MIKKTRKLISTFMLVTMLLFTLSSSAYGQTSVTAAGADQLAIKNVINDYFKTEFEAIKHNHYDNNVINNSKLKEYQTLYSDYLNQWYNSVGANLISYNQNLNINSITFENGKYSVDVTDETGMVFDIAPNITQKAITNYNFIIEKIGNKLQIDDFKNLSDLNFNLDNEIDKINTNTKNIKDISTKFRPNKIRTTKLIQSAAISSLATASFNRTAAVDYAHTWAYSYNPGWMQFSDDCTNFVSQCWNAAGINMTAYWYSYLDSNSWTRSWTVVDDFYTYMINNGWCYSGTQSQVQLGDVIQLYNSTTNSWSHSMITTNFDYYGNILYSAHSQPRYDYALYNVYPGLSNYTNIRFMCVYNF